MDAAGFNINLFLAMKSLHIIAVISWMAGLLYLPRLFTYHCQAKEGSQMDKTFQLMEKKLLRFIMNPAMIASFIFGLGMIHFIGFGHGWLHVKLFLVILLAAFHGFLAKCRQDFIKGKNKHAQKFYRIINEVPTVLMIIIVFLVIFKSF